MRAKLSVLRACRQLLRPGGRIAFYTIFIPPGISREDRERVLRLGDPPEVASAAEQGALLRSAGFSDIDETDVTGEFLVTARGWLGGRERFAAQLRRREGAAAFDEGQTNRRARVAAIGAGLLRRALFVAVRH